jgi:P4 family phage/plasmid primase-like protien
MTYGSTEYVYHDGDFCLFNGCCYDRVERGYIKQMVDTFVVERWGVDQATARIVEEVVNVLENRGYRSSGLTPRYLTAGGPTDCLVVRNGIINFDYLSFGHAGYDYDPVATCPLYNEYKELVTAGDSQLSDLMDEVGGYCLLLSLQYQVSFFAVGPGKNGKSVWLSLIESVLGPTNVSHVPLEKYGSEFCGHQMLGKHANLVPDANYLGQVGEAAFREIVGGDVMQFNRKYKEPVNSVVQARTIVSCNAMPKFYTPATFRRIIILPFDVRIGRAQRIHSFERRLLPELPGVLNRWIAGARRVVANQHFIEPTRSVAALTQAKNEADPVRHFLADCYIADPAGEELTDDLWDQWTNWAQQNSPKSHVSRESLCRGLVSSFPDARRRRLKSRRQFMLRHVPDATTRKGKGRTTKPVGRPWGYVGVRYLPPEMLRPGEIDPYADPVQPLSIIEEAIEDVKRAPPCAADKPHKRPPTQEEIATETAIEEIIDDLGRQSLPGDLAGGTTAS